MLTRSLLALGVTVSLAVCGCGPSDNQSLIESAKGQNCGASAYTPFDPANHAAQDQRIAVQPAIADKAAEAINDLSKAPEVFDAIAGLYQGTAELQVKVQGRADDHFPGDAEAAKVGQQIDGEIMGAIARGKAATTTLDVEIAAEVIDKNLTRFFYLSVYHELVEGTRGTYDEAYGYLGTGPHNDAAAALSLASVARSRDATNQTDYSQRLFQAVIDGSCALDTRLMKDDAASIDWKSDAGYAAQVEQIDRLMIEVLAMTVGHEMTEIADAPSPDDAVVEFYEGAVMFEAIEAQMRAKGTDAAADADQIAKMFDDAKTALEGGDPSWAMGFDPTFVRDKVAAVFGVTVKG